MSVVIWLAITVALYVIFISVFGKALKEIDDQNTNWDTFKDEALLSIITQKLGVSTYSVFRSSFVEISGVAFPNHIDQAYDKYLRNQEVPVRVREHMINLLKGKTTFNYASDA